MNSGEKQWIFKWSNSNIYLLSTKHIHSDHSSSSSLSHHCLSCSSYYRFHVFILSRTNFSNQLDIHFSSPFLESRLLLSFQALFLEHVKAVLRLLASKTLSLRICLEALDEKQLEICLFRGNVTLSRNKALCRQQSLLHGHLKQTECHFIY